jgi:Xaa-Pro dipeptidase
VLHYQHYDRTPPARRLSFLIDAGGKYRGYASDITRTHAVASGDFADLIAALDERQQRLANDIRPGQRYLDLHERMQREVGELLVEFGLVTCSAEAAFEQRITDAFLPHGLGHLLGLQTHDVGGHLASADGRVAPPPERYPALRLTRTIEAEQVFTVEPGMYFIPMLLDRLRNSSAAGSIRWRRVEAFLPYGGIRIEDNVRVTASGIENLTRDAFTAAAAR